MSAGSINGKFLDVAGLSINGAPVVPGQGAGGVASINGATGVITFTGAVGQTGNTFNFTGGGGGGVAGTNKQLQYNNNGVFGGAGIEYIAATKSLTAPSTGNSIILDDGGDITLLSPPGVGSINLTSVDEGSVNINAGGAVEVSAASLAIGDTPLTVGGNFGTAGQYLASAAGGTNTWEDIPPPAAAGTDGQLQINNGGVLGGAGIDYISTKQTLLAVGGNKIDFNDAGDINISALASGGNIDIISGDGAASVSITGGDGGINLNAPNGSFTTINNGRIPDGAPFYFSADAYIEIEGTGTGDANQVLTSLGGDAGLTWANPTAPAGTDKQLQFNNAGVFGGAGIEYGNSESLTATSSGNSIAFDKAGDLIINSLGGGINIATALDNNISIQAGTGSGDDVSEMNLIANGGINVNSNGANFVNIYSLKIPGADNITFASNAGIYITGIGAGTSNQVLTSLGGGGAGLTWADNSVGFTNPLSDYGGGSIANPDTTYTYTLDSGTQPLLTGLTTNSLITATLQNYDFTTTDGTSCWIVACRPVANSIDLTLAAQVSNPAAFVPCVIINKY